MPLPSNLSTVTVTGTYLTLDGAPATGTISFTPQVAAGSILTDPTGTAMLVPNPPPTATLDGTGSFSIALPATDDTDLQPNGWTYLVQAQFGNTKATPYSISLPAATSPVDLKSKAPSVPVTASVVMVRSVNGTLPDASGNVVVAGGGGSGTGTVTAVNSVAPDGTGNVTLTAANVGALTQSVADGRYDALGAATTAAASKAQGLTPTAVKTSAYTAAAGDYVPVDISAGPVTVTLPSAPADKTRIAVQAVAVAGSNTVTIATAGADVLNTAAGPTSMTLASLNQGVVLQYAATPHIWYVQTGATGAAGATGATGAAGATGATGTAGTRGSQWFFGAGVPGTVTGSQTGDIYLDVNAGDIYQLS